MSTEDIFNKSVPGTVFMTVKSFLTCQLIAPIGAPWPAFCLHVLWGNFCDNMSVPLLKAVNKHFSDASCQMLSDVVSDARCVILLVRLNHLVGHNVKCLMPVASDAKCLTLVVWLKHWMRLGPMSAGAASCQWCQMFDESWFPVMASQCNNASPLFWPQSLSLFFAGKNMS